MTFAPYYAHALSADHYAESSRLASGKWAKVRVTETGMQFLSAANLKKFGFSDPSKVRVYGFGGRELPGTITASDPDDLPLAPSVATAKGIYFFGYSHIRWNAVSSGSSLRFTHTMHSYAEESWYFLSDCSEDTFSPDKAPSYSDDASLPEIDSFIQPVLHEQDLFHPADTGSRYLGEDFRSPTKRSFEFSLTDPVEGQDALLRIAFATNTTASSQLSIVANGRSPLDSSPSISFSGVSDAETFMRYASTTRNIAYPGNSLKLDLTFQGGGTIKMARLDFIELQYLRKLNLSGGELHFTIDARQTSRVKLTGAEASTIVWDITDPANPRRMETSVSGSTARFVTERGVREYIAFTPDKCGRSIAASTPVANQDLHALGIPDMLIIAPAAYRDAATRLAAHHQEWDGLKCHILAPETIYNEFSSGTPDVTAFRRLLKMWYDRGLALDAASADDESGDENESSASRIKYCLILGRPTFDNKMKMDATKNAGYPIVPIWQSATGEAETTSFSTDDYIGMLADASYFEIGRQKIQVAVGRMPFISSAEATQLTDKYINYVTKPETGAWRNRIMFIADDQNYGDHLNQSEDMISSYLKTGQGKKFRFERVYLDSYPLQQSSRGPVYPAAKEKMLQLWNDGVMMINYIGHASTVSWTHEDLLNWTDMTSFSNSRCPFLYAATCEFGRFDATARSGAETLWAYPDAGIIATITPSRTVYIDMNGKLSHQVSLSMMTTDSEGKARRIGDIIREAKNNYPSNENTNRLRYAIIGNPAMRLPVPEKDVVLCSINGIDVESPIAAADYPVLNAQGKATLQGEVRNPDGSPADDFNGMLEIHLYDAEKVVSTYGNGKAGIVSHYNDRKTLLYHGMTKVTDGKWSTTALLPSEIENNFSPAQFTFYAYTPDRKEAHGENSRFYVYGYDPDAEEDSQGPEISMLALNRDDFQPGQVVHSSPVLMARISDPSGINISDAGIGHGMTVVLDDRTYFTDVNGYYTPDSDDYTAGDIVYPIADIEPGKHTLKLVVWDNAKNSSTASIDFEVAVAKAPEIYSISTDVNPARDHVNFTLSTDRPMAKVECRVEVFDLDGRRVWISERQISTDMSASLAVPWDLCDATGTRVPRGIYLYRATITSPEGPAASATHKLAVATP